MSFERIHRHCRWLVHVTQTADGITHRLQRRHPIAVSNRCQLIDHTVRISSCITHLIVTVKQSKETLERIHPRIIEPSRQIGKVVTYPPKHAKTAMPKTLPLCTRPAGPEGRASACFRANAAALSAALASPPPAMSVEKGYVSVTNLVRQA